MSGPNGIFVHNFYWLVLKRYKKVQIRHLGKVQKGGVQTPLNPLFFMIGIPITNYQFPLATTENET